jgi:hypothetical protein
LQEISYALSVWALETTLFKKLENVFSWTMVHNLALRQQNDIIEKLKGLGCWLQKRHENGGFHHMAKLSQALDNLESGGAVKTC